MDKVAKTILETLMANARTSKVALAKKLRVTEAAVRKRMKKLEEAGILLGYKAVVDYQKAGLAASITGVDTEPEKLWSVINVIKRIEAVKMLSLTSGDHMVITEIVADNIEALEEIHKRIGRVEGVKRVCPAIILKRIK